MRTYLFTSESVAIGHPDKVADQISDAILDACLSKDPHARVACETLVTSGLVILAGEITTNASIPYQDICRQTIKEIGYDHSDLGFDYKSCGILLTINKQSPDIAQGVERDGDTGAGDQGIMFGYASDETEELMPLPIMFAHRIVQELRRLREVKELAYLRPDAKAQVTIEYSQDHKPLRIHTVVISTQHTEEAAQETVARDMRALIQRIAPMNMLDDRTIYHINPTGRFVIGGPVGDCGLTGRKIIIDTYGGMGRHGGGAFSGKDPTKVDRSANYAARYVAKNVVAAGLAKRCEVQLAYAIGVCRPVSIKVDTFGTQTVPHEDIEDAIMQAFDLSPRGIIEMLDLLRPIYKKTAFGGHFGRELPEFTWERTDRAKILSNIFTAARKQ